MLLAGLEGPAADLDLDSCHFAAEDERPPFGAQENSVSLVVYVDDISALDTQQTDWAIAVACRRKPCAFPAFLRPQR